MLKVTSIRVEEPLTYNYSCHYHSGGSYWNLYKLKPGAVLLYKFLLIILHKKYKKRVTLEMHHGYIIKCILHHLKLLLKFNTFALKYIKWVKERIPAKLPFTTYLSLDGGLSVLLIKSFLVLLCWQLTGCRILITKSEGTCRHLETCIEFLQHVFKVLFSSCSISKANHTWRQQTEETPY